MEGLWHKEQAEVEVRVRREEEVPRVAEVFHGLLLGLMDGSRVTAAGALPEIGRKAVDVAVKEVAVVVVKVLAAGNVEAALALLAVGEKTNIWKLEVNGADSKGDDDRRDNFEDRDDSDRRSRSYDDDRDERRFANDEDREERSSRGSRDDDDYEDSGRGRGRSSRSRNDKGRFTERSDRGYGRSGRYEERGYSKY